MATESTKKQFADLLANGIAAIQRQESVEKKKLVKEIYKELANHIRRQPSAIAYFLRGNVPSSVIMLEELALEIARRGQLDTEWLQQFLNLGGHPNPSRVCEEAEQSGIRGSKKTENPFIHLNSPTTISELRSLSEHQRKEILKARAVDAVAITMWRLLPAYQDEFLTMLRNGGTLRILLAHYDSAAIQMAAFRSSSRTSDKTQANRVIENLRLLAKWKTNIPTANIEVKLFDFLPPYGITLVYPQNPDAPSSCLVRLNTFRSPSSLAPSMSPSPLEDKHWFDFFCEQFRLMWDAGVTFDVTTEGQRI